MAVNWRVWTRKSHRWGAILVALPFLLVIATGILLQLKKHWAFVQPPEQRGSVHAPQITFAQMLAAAQAAPGAAVGGWDDVERIDVRPARGLAKLTLRGGIEVQVDIGDGTMLQCAPRRSDLIESMHDGSFFAGDWTKLGLFLPSGIALLGMWLTGVWLFWLPLSVQRKRRKVAMATAPGAAPRTPASGR